MKHANGSPRRKSDRRLSAKAVAEITGAIDHLEAAIALYRQVLAADDPAVALSWKHAVELH